MPERARFQPASQPVGVQQSSQQRSPPTASSVPRQQPAAVLASSQRRSTPAAISVPASSTQRSSPKPAPASSQQPAASIQRPAALCISAHSRPPKEISEQVAEAAARFGFPSKLVNPTGSRQPAAQRSAARKPSRLAAAAAAAAGGSQTGGYSTAPPSRRAWPQADRSRRLKEHNREVSGLGTQGSTLQKTPRRVAGGGCSGKEDRSTARSLPVSRRGAAAQIPGVVGGFRRGSAAPRYMLQPLLAALPHALAPSRHPSFSSRLAAHCVKLRVHIGFTTTSSGKGGHQARYQGLQPGFQAGRDAVQRTSRHFPAALSESKATSAGGGREKRRRDKNSQQPGAEVSGFIPRQRRQPARDLCRRGRLAAPVAGPYPSGTSGFPRPAVLSAGISPRRRRRARLTETLCSAALARRGARAHILRCRRIAGPPYMRDRPRRLPNIGGPLTPGSRVACGLQRLTAEGGGAHRASAADEHVPTTARRLLRKLLASFSCALREADHFTSRS
ncbi:translation initiation factor IF-2-like [Schistocerca piceifrons]|uniref:translation initiation factor IF-2-like n=1 Tax=Schistocerca piceifrons TaxID=274613 RepID=UPI001F5E5B33|nr:translation initiation factor IF-2-like [Schistocerca piceifrons]